IDSIDSEMSTRKKSDYLRKSKAYILLFALLPFFMMKIFHHHTDFVIIQNDSTINNQTTIVTGSEKCAICDVLLTFFTIEKELFLSITPSIFTLELTKSLDKIYDDTPTPFFLRAPPLFLSSIL
ncbi:MAG: hypothetical protein PHT78_10160, partial [Desulfitobacteriaceae bacterium]|nr:hypothetical protein [Desulfitobacteriaceae bacterium]